MSRLADTLAERSDRDRRRTLGDLVRATTAELLGWEPAAVDPDKPYQEYGYNSMAAVELTRLLSAETGLELPLTLLFDHPTPAAVADHLLALFDFPAVEPAVVEPSVAVADPGEPLAIVGMACRYPGGVSTPDELWELVAEGRDAVGTFPTDRGWDLDALFAGDGPGQPSGPSGPGQPGGPGRPGTSHARAAGFLADVAGFDAEFFGVAPREAVATDPQQRLLLETAWEALEHAGIDPTSVRDSATGVFVGVSTQDYAWLARGSAELEGYWGLGNAGSIASGRIAYKLGLRGPVLTVDTACSSSLVALHLAGQSLRTGECSLALVGGAAVLATPTMFVEFSRQGALSTDGRCRSFAEGADGTGWAEGVGILAVTTLSEARRRGWPVHALVRGSAVNSDGASNGLTAPNGPAQQRVIRAALANAGLEASDVDVVEAHGTGTALGDPIEAGALLATYGQDRSRPLWLGSLKSNIGHAQAAAGVGGVIKMVQAMRHGTVPATLHANRPTQAVDWSAGKVRLATEPVDWPAVERPRRAAVSAFGIGGTNAHVIVEEPPPTEPTLTKAVQGDAEPTLASADEIGGVAEPEPASVGGVEPEPAPAGAPTAWLLAARSAEALRAQAAAMAGVAAPPVAVAHALVGRTRFAHRAVVVGATAERLRAGAAEVAGGEPPSAGARGEAGRAGGLAVLFTGQGSQRVGAGRELAERYPVFAGALDETAEVLDPLLGCPLRTVLFEDEELLHRTRYTQAGLFALEVALYRLVESWGLRPDALLGHSVGELAAAHVAGVLSLADAATLVAARGRLMDELPRGGVMVAVEAAESELTLDGAVSLAAVNGPRAVVLSGPAEAVLAETERWRAAGRRTKRLTVSHAFHSALIEPALAELAEVAAGLTYAPPSIPVVSNVTGAVVGEELCTPEYWVRHARGTVRFADGLAALRRAGATAYLELGPTAALTPMARVCLPAATAVVPTLRARRPESESLLTALGELHVRGIEPDWAAVLDVPAGPKVPLPTYPFQRRRYWVSATPAGRRTPASAALAGSLPAPGTLAAEQGGMAPLPAAASASTGHAAAAGDSSGGFAGVTAGSASAGLVGSPVAGERARAAAVRSSAGGSPLAVVRAQVAVVLGHADGSAIDPERTLFEQGVDSIGGAELHRRLADVTGVDLPPTLLLDHPTPAAMAAALAGLTRAGEPAPAELGTLTGLVRTAHERGELPRMVPLLAEASRLRPSFADGEVAADTVLVSDGAREPTLVCLPSFLAGSGPHQFARFAAALRRRRRVAALALPGFGADPRLPATWSAAVTALATAAREAAGDGPLVLVGYSIGGVVAHAVAHELAHAGRKPDGVVMVDTFEPVGEDHAVTFGWAMGQIIDRDHDYLVIDDPGVLAMGAYLRVFDEWTPTPAPVRGLLLRADRPATGRHAHDWHTWQAADETVDVPGDHFSVLDQDVATTAAALEAWLDR